LWRSSFLKNLEKVSIPKYQNNDKKGSKNNKPATGVSVFQKTA
jgi:hypothetical protein